MRGLRCMHKISFVILKLQKSLLDFAFYPVKVYKVSAREPVILD